MPAPPSVVCPLCGTQDDLEPPTALPDGAWQFVCNGYHDPTPWTFEVSADAKVATHHQGLATELGMWEDLPAVLVSEQPPAEYGVVEYRYALAHPSEYAELVKLYGHTADGPKKYTASAFIAKTLGQLATDGVLIHSAGPATGYWSYNGTISYWSPASVAAPSVALTWHQFALAEGFDPMDWPPLGYRHPAV